MPDAFKDCSVLVTGGTRGIGWATARAFAARGACVTITGRCGDEAAERAAQVQGTGPGRAWGVELDVTDRESVAAVFAQVRSARGALDVLVANAGELDQGPVGAIRPEAARRLMDVNVLGTLACVQAAARLMLPRRSGAMVLLASAVGERGAAGQSVYAASKAGVAALARSAAAELGPRGIRVNAVAPGLVDTDMAAQIPSGAIAAHTARCALRRTGTADEVASVITFLAGEDAAYVCGQVLTVDGGWA